MAKIFARRSKEDGLYRYGLWVLPQIMIGPLFVIETQGLEDHPTYPSTPATDDEHEQWLANLRTHGYTVTVTPVDETNSM